MNEPVCDKIDCPYYQSFFKPNKLIQSYMDIFMDKNKTANAYHAINSVKDMCLACIYFKKQDIPELLTIAEAIYLLKEEE